MENRGEGESDGGHFDFLKGDKPNDRCDTSLSPLQRKDLLTLLWIETEIGTKHVPQGRLSESETLSQSSFHESRNNGSTSISSVV